MPRKLTGLRRKRGGWQAYVKVGGTTYTQQFPIETPIPDMRAWRKTERTKRRGALPAVAAFGFEADVRAYLKLPDIAASPSVKQRAAQLALWVDALGRDRARITITPTEIEAVLQRWLTTLSPVTVDHRRTVLLSCFVKLDGADGANPVRATNKPRLPEPEARDVDYPTIARILDAMPTLRSSAPGTVRTLSLAKLRATVMAYTGIPPSSLVKIRAVDLDFAGATFRSPARLKGKGARARVLPLTADGLAAFRAFHVANAYGWFAVGALSHSFKRAVRCVPTAPAGMRLYDLRHSFGAELYRRTGDLATVARFLGHAPGSTVTARYALGANAEVDRAAADAFDAARLAEQTPAAAPQADANAARSRKRRSVRRFEKAG